MTTETHLKAEAVKYWSNWPMGDPLHLAGDQVLDYKAMVAAVGRLLEPIPDEIWEQARKEVGRIAYQWGEDEPNGATGFALLEEASQITNAVERVIRRWLIGGEKP